jgi:hypothetical protein
LATIVPKAAPTVNKRLKRKKILDKSKKDLTFAVLYFDFRHNGVIKANKISSDVFGGFSTEKK